MAAALPVLPVAVLAPSWYANELGIGFLLTGIALAVARLLDLFSDPLIGVLSDRLNWRGHHYKPWALGGAILAAIGMAAVAFPPAKVGPVYLGLSMLLLFTGWTAFTIPYTAWGADLADTAHERSLLAASREVCGLVGMLLALIIPASLAVLLGGQAPEPLAVLSVVLILLGAPALWLLLRFVPEPARHAHGVTVRLADLGQLMRFTPARKILVCWFVNGIANGLPAVLFPVIVADLLRLDDQSLYLLLVAYFGAAVLSAPLWLELARAAGKVRAWQIAIVCNMLVFSQALWLDAAHASWFVSICILSGATLAADLALPASIQADVMELDRHHNGRSRTASAFALWSMSTKLALAMAVGVAFVGVGSGSSDGAIVAPDRLLFFYVLLPLCLKACVLLMLQAAAKLSAPVVYPEIAND